MASPSIVLLHMSQEFDDWIMPSPPHKCRTSRFLACDSDAGPTPPAIRRRFHTGKLHSALSPQITHVVQEKLHVCSATTRDAAGSFVHRATAARFTFPQPYHLHHLQLQSIGQQYRQYRTDIILHRPFVQERTPCIHISAKKACLHFLLRFCGQEPTSTDFLVLLSSKASFNQLPKDLVNHLILFRPPVVQGLPSIILANPSLHRHTN